VHKKLTSRNDREPSLFDLFGLRVVVPSVADCYQALGVVHLAFSPVPRRFKDYVARPKPNGYRSLHTVVRLSRSADPVEVQIRSEEMHAEAERGRAAHVRYKHPELSSETDRWVYALTPAGEVRRLPRGATVLDFAYAIHTEIGRGYAGARIGEKMVSATHELATGDVVEVFHIARPGGAATQLASVHTARARNRIRAGLIARAAY
jgi:(p)ppGpp synthase/HD superfamily hydrolase